MSAPDPGGLAAELASAVGDPLLDALVDVLPVLVPFLVALWALGFIWGKLGSGMLRDAGGNGPDSFACMDNGPDGASAHGETCYCYNCEARAEIEAEEDSYYRAKYERGGGNRDPWSGAG